MLIPQKLGIVWTLRFSTRLYQFSTMSSSSVPLPSTPSSTSGILMILSPAKTLDLTPWENDKEEIGILTPTQPDCSPEHTQEIALWMKQRTTSELAKLLSLSSTLAQTATEYWKAFIVDRNRTLSTSSSSSSSSVSSTNKPCIFAFSGAAYQGLQIQDCDSTALFYLQSSLRIIDPLYGVLRPMDQIQPYRLEMATKGVLHSNNNNNKIKLADYWKSSVTQRLSQDLQQYTTPILLNLASDEYSAAVDPKQLSPSHTKYIKVIFKDNGKVIAVHAKRARGLMVRYLSSIQATTLEEVKKFTLEGYKYQPQDSDDTTLVFHRSSSSSSSMKGASVKNGSKRTKNSTTTSHSPSSTPSTTKRTKRKA